MFLIKKKQPSGPSLPFGKRSESKRTPSGDRRALQVVCVGNPLGISFEITPGVRSTPWVPGGDTKRSASDSFFLDTKRSLRHLWFPSRLPTFSNSSTLGIRRIPSGTRRVPLAIPSVTRCNLIKNKK
jgi:hypothetical protein